MKQNNATMLKRSPSLTEQVKAYLKQRIINAEFEAGRIPSEADLASELNVSRSTIRDALSRLETEGVIYRRQGAGTFVNETGLQIKTRLEEIWDYEAVLRLHGYTPSNRIVGIEQQGAAPDLVEDLGLAPGHSVVVVQKLFFADSKPVILTCNYIPVNLIKQPYTDDDFHLPMYQFLPQFCRQELTYYFSEIIPLTAPDWLVDKLQLPPHKRVLISFEEIGYNQNNEPIIKAFSYFRDDLLRLRLIRRQV